MHFSKALEEMKAGNRVRRSYPTTPEQGPSWEDAGRSLGIETRDGLPTIVQRMAPPPPPTFRASGPGPDYRGPWYTLTPDLLAEDWEVCG